MRSYLHRHSAKNKHGTTEKYFRPKYTHTQATVSPEKGVAKLKINTIAIQTRVCVCVICGKSSTKDRHNNLNQHTHLHHKHTHTCIQDCMKHTHHLLKYHYKHQHPPPLFYAIAPSLPLFYLPLSLQRIVGVPPSVN